MITAWLALTAAGVAAVIALKLIDDEVQRRRTIARRLNG